MSESADSIPYRTGGVSLAIGKAHKVSVPPFTFRARLTGLLFDTSKAFLLPGAIHGMRALKRLHDEHKGMKLLVTGHTDRAGSDDYNLKLSNERAESIRAYLRDQVEEWFKFYGPSISQEKRWGATEDSLMIGQVVPAEKLEGGKPPPMTVENIKAFQRFSNETRSTNLDPDGKMGPATRRALIAAYMAQPDTSLPPEVEILTHGCGEFHNEVPTPDGVALQENRRVEIFFFDGPIKPPPRKPCPGPAGCPEYEEWKKQSSKTIDLDKGSGTLEITVRDGPGKAIEDASVHLEGPFSEDSTTDADGLAKFPDLPAGAYTVSAAKDEFEDAETNTNLADGADEKVTLTLKSLLFDLDVQVQTDSGRPLRDAQVSIDAPGVAPATSDAEGIAQLKGIPRGRFRITAVHSGFKQGVVETPIPRPAPKDTPTQALVQGAGQERDAPSSKVPVSLSTEPVVLVVKVVDADNPSEALKSVKVTVRQNITGDVNLSKTTPEDGTALTFNDDEGLLRGLCEVSAEQTGLVTQLQTVNLVEVQNEVTFKMKGALAAQIEPVDEDGGALTGVRLEVGGPSPRVVENTTDAVVLLTGMRPGKNYIALAIKRGFESSPSTPFELPQRNPLRLVLRGHADVAVTVTDKQTSAGIEGAAVEIRRAGAAPLNAKAGSGGVALFKDVIAGTYAIGAKAAFHRDGRGADVPAKKKADNEGSVALEAVNEVEITVVDAGEADPAKRLVDKAQVLLKGRETKTKETARGVAAIPDVLIGDYTVEVSHPDFLASSPQTLKVEGGEKGKAKATVQLARVVTLEAFVKFEAWDVSAKRFVPVGDAESDLIEDGRPDRVLVSARTGADGIVQFQVKSDKRRAGKAIDFKLKVKPGGRNIGGTGFPAEWSTQGWKSADGASEGLQKGFTGASFGSAALPIVFRIGVDFHVRLRFTPPPPKRSDEAAAIEQAVAEGIFVTVVSGLLARGEEFSTDAKGEVHGVAFGLKPGADAFVRVEDGAKFPRVSIKNDRIKLPKTTFVPSLADEARGGLEAVVPGLTLPVLLPETPLWFDRVPTLRETSIATQDAPRPIQGTGMQAAAMYIFKILSEWTEFLFHITAGAWQGVPELKIYAFSHLRTNINSYSFPLGKVHYVPDHHFNRGVIAHEMAHQIMWKESNFPLTSLGPAFLQAPVHSEDLWSFNVEAGLLSSALLAQARVLPLYEGWAEFIESIFTGQMTTEQMLRVLREVVIGNPPHGRGTIPRGPVGSVGAKDRALNRGEECEGSVANGLFTTYLEVIKGQTVPENITTAGFQPWAPAAKDRFMSLIWEPLQQIRNDRAPDSRTFLDKVKAAALRLNLWHEVAARLHRFNLMMDGPTIASIDPPRGPPGSQVTIFGTEFVSGETVVDFGGVALPSAGLLLPSSPGQPYGLRVTVPEGPPGPVTVVVKNAAGLVSKDFSRIAP